MAREHDIALCPWNVLASGKLRNDAEEEPYFPLPLHSNCQTSALLAALARNPDELPDQPELFPRSDPTSISPSHQSSLTLCHPASSLPDYPPMTS
ncbi:hypothetical protein B0H13DRAFT_2350168 [Mycena leptocephala]|nr:hypothetical protein B0H13DRAFT_2350168 [Mycena leptocephala]